MFSGWLFSLYCFTDDKGKPLDHTVKPAHLFQNTTRRLPKFPRTHRGDILPFVVVAKKHCAQILATMRALLYDRDPNGQANFELVLTLTFRRCPFNWGGSIAL